MTFGGEAARIKFAETVGAIYADDGARTAVLGVLTLWGLLWFATKPEVWQWLRSFRRLAPDLYVTLRISAGDRIALVSPFWDPNRLELGMSISSRAIVDPPQNDGLELVVFNASPDDIRHLEMTWLVEDFRPSKELSKHNVFGDFLDRVDTDTLRFLTEKRVINAPCNTRVVGPIVPVIASGHSVTVKAPIPFTNALAVMCLTEAKKRRVELQSSPPPQGLSEVVDWMAKETISHDNARIEVSFVRGQKKIRQKFSLLMATKGMDSLYGPLDGAEDGPLHPIDGSAMTLVEIYQVRHDDYGVIIQGIPKSDWGC